MDLRTASAGSLAGGGLGARVGLPWGEHEELQEESPQGEPDHVLSEGLMPGGPRGSCNDRRIAEDK